MTERVVLYVDFNDLDEDRRVPAYLVRENAAEDPQPGAVVELHDDEGNSCLGYVIERHGDDVLVQPEWTTWRRSNFYRPQVQYQPPAEDLAKMLLDVAKMRRKTMGTGVSDLAERKG
jgi:hypothetical protein